MSGYTFTLSGADKLKSTLDAVADSRTTLARITVKRGLSVVRTSMVRAAPGRVKLEFGAIVESGNGTATGYVGLGTGGYRAKVKRPHGIYLDQGTPTIPARNFVSTAFVESQRRALIAMKAVAKKVIRYFTSKAQGGRSHG